MQINNFRSNRLAGYEIHCECGHEPLQYFWFRSAVKLYNSILMPYSVTVQKVLRADLSIHSREPSCWTAKVWMHFKSCGVVMCVCPSSKAECPYLNPGIY